MIECANEEQSDGEERDHAAFGSGGSDDNLIPPNMDNGGSQGDDRQETAQRELEIYRRERELAEKELMLARREIKLLIKVKN